MKPRWHLSWGIIVAATDALCITGALVAVAVARFGPEALRAGFVPAPGRAFAQAPLALAIPVWLTAFGIARLYSPQRCQNALEEGRRLLTSALGAAVALLMLGFLLKENPARSWLLGSVVVGTLAAAVGRQSVRAFVGRLRLRGKWTTPAVVVGRRQAKSVVEALIADPTIGVVPVAACGFEQPGIPHWDVLRVREAVHETRAAQIVIVAEGLERSETAAAVEVADDLPVNVVVLPGLDYLLLSSLQLVTVGHEPGLALESRSRHTVQRAAKRLIDITGAGILLILTSPLIALTALAVRLDSAGPVIFKQKREGKGGRVFDALKFRTMRQGTEAGQPEIAADDDLSFLSKPEEDSRVTRVGRVLRRLSVDELPQFVNVLRGDMSLVGPRPLPLWEAEKLGLRRRLAVRPGLTGLWQVSGLSSLSPEERVRLDLVYVQNWSLILDLSILLRTVPTVVIGRGAF